MPEATPVPKKSPDDDSLSGAAVAAECAKITVAYAAKLARAKALETVGKLSEANVNFHAEAERQARRALLDAGIYREHSVSRLVSPARFDDAIEFTVHLDEAAAPDRQALQSGLGGSVQPAHPQWTVILSSNKPDITFRIPLTDLGFRGVVRGGMNRAISTIGGVVSHTQFGRDLEAISEGIDASLDAEE